MFRQTLRGRICVGFFSHLHRIAQSTHVKNHRLLQTAGSVRRAFVRLERDFSGATSTAFTMTLMASFEYEAPFVPSRPRKKRKNRMPQERPDPAVVLANTMQELVSCGWVGECTRMCLIPLSPVVVV